jgi:hypothetical protein
VAWVHLVFFAVYVGLGAGFVRAVFQRREAVMIWRAAVGGAFDGHQGRFATELDLDRATLPPRAQLLLRESRRVVFGCSLVLLALLALQLWMMVG